MLCSCVSKQIRWKDNRKKKRKDGMEKGVTDDIQTRDRHIERCNFFAGCGCRMSLSSLNKLMKNISSGSRRTRIRRIPKSPSTDNQQVAFFFITAK